jgi:hypothetical protein
MKHPGYPMFIAIAFQLWLLASLWWMLHWRKHVRRSNLTGWRAAPVALAPMAMLLIFCIAGLIRGAMEW